MQTGRTEFYQEHLDRVSRSFAFCIRQLPSPLRDWIALSYLLCRTLDTIEDAAWPSGDAQLAAFRDFDRALLLEGNNQALDKLTADFTVSLPASERLLLQDAPGLFADLQALPAPVRDIMRELISVMSAGMQHFTRKKSGGDLRLQTLAEVNQYCFFVAGVVGELLAKLVATVEPRFVLSQVNLLRAHHFGLFLQKVNLLKDQVGDEKSGRHLIPSRDVVELSSSENADSALEFLLDLPKEQVEFRRFCAWSLFLGLEALNVARRSVVEQRVIKVGRDRANELLVEVESGLNDDGALRSLFGSFQEKLGWVRAVASSPIQQEIPTWLLSLYRGPLSAASMSQLGMAR